MATYKNPQLATASRAIVTDASGNMTVGDGLPAIYGNANVLHAGVWTPYATLALAKAAAVSGDTIVVGPGTYDEANLLKNGVNWYFYPGAVVAYTGATNVAIWDDGAAGANGAVSCTIGGHGEFSNEGTGGTGNRIFTIGNSSVISVTCRKMSSSKSNLVRVVANSSEMNIRCETMTCSADTDAVYALVGTKQFIIDCDYLENTSTGSSASTFMTFSTVYGTFKSILGATTATNKGVVTIADGAASLKSYIVAERIANTNASSAGYAVYNTGDTTNNAFVTAHEITSRFGTAIYSAQGALHVNADLVQTSRGPEYAVDGTGGTIHLNARRIVNSDTNGVPVKLTGAVVKTYGAVALVADAGATDGITAADAKTIAVYGTIVSNKALNANVSVLVAPAANQIFGSSDVS